MKIAVKDKKRVFFCTQSKAVNWLGAARMSKACRGSRAVDFNAQSNRDMWRKFLKKNRVIVHQNRPHKDHFAQPFPQSTYY